MTKNQNTKNQKTKNQMTKNQMTKNQMTKNQMTKKIKTKLNIVTRPCQRELDDSMHLLCGIQGNSTLLDYITYAISPELGYPTVDKGPRLPTETPIAPFFFKTLDGHSGHWYYYNTTRKKMMNSYDERHQRTGTHQFCATFALIYFLGQSSSGHPITRFVNHLRAGDYAHNIRVVIQFWRSIMNSENKILHGRFLLAAQEENRYFEIENSTNMRKLSQMPVLTRVTKRALNQIFNKIDNYADFI